MKFEGECLMILNDASFAMNDRFRTADVRRNSARFQDGSQWDGHGQLDRFSERRDNRGRAVSEHQVHGTVEIFNQRTSWTAHSSSIVMVNRCRIELLFHGTQVWANCNDGDSVRAGDSTFESSAGVGFDNAPEGGQVGDNDMRLPDHI